MYYPFCGDELKFVRIGIFRRHPQYHTNFVQFPPENSEGLFIEHWARNPIAAEWKASHCNLFYANNCRYPRLFFTRKKPIIGDLEGFIPPSIVPGLEERVGDPQIKKIFAQTKWAYNDAMRLIKKEENREKVEVLYHAWRTDVHKSKRDDNEVRFFFIGESFFLKGAEWAVEAFKELYKKYDNIRLTVVSTKFDHNYFSRLTGKPLENPPWKEPLETYMNHPGITFLPRRISEQEKLDQYSNSDVFIFPSRWETFGCVFLEAMAFSLPILACNFGPIPEILRENQNAFLLNTRDKRWEDLFTASKVREQMIQDLKGYMEQLIVSDSLRNKMGRASRELLETEYSIERRNKRIRQIYDEIVG